MAKLITNFKISGQLLGVLFTTLRTIQEKRDNVITQGIISF